MNQISSLLDTDADTDDSDADADTDTENILFWHQLMQDNKSIKLKY